jgi:thiol:disulfide interchange protein/thiol-disulfide isomerase/thioredoxin
MSRIGAGSALTALLFSAAPALAEDPKFVPSAGFEPGVIGPGETAKLAIDVAIPEGWHLWSLDPGEGPQALAIQGPPDTIDLEGDWYGVEPEVVFDPGFKRDLKQYEGGKTVRFSRIARMKRGTPAGEVSVPFVIRGQICNPEQCLSQRHVAVAKIQIAPGPTGAAAPALEGVALRGPRRSVVSFLLLAFLAGLGALATPCVFPAIPLTVSFFSKFSGESFARGSRLAGFYAISMVACFTLAGVVISVLVGATGVQRFAAHPVFNLILAFVLVFFSLNLLGMFEIRVPAFLLDLTNRLESKYGPNAKEEGHTERWWHTGLRDYIAVGVAAMTATTVFFTCTVAFVGMVVVAASKGEWFWPTVGMLAFSSAFVLPFFLLALFPQAAKRLRGKSGSWLTATRVTLGFLELAAAIKFFSNADLVWGTNVLSRDMALSFWVALFALCGLFLLGKLHLAEEQPAPEAEAISVPRMLLSAVTFAFTLYLGLGLYTGRPLGWVDGWLPPSSSTIASTSNGSGLRWIHDLTEGRKQAAERRSLVFVNYTGFTCTNCRYMESAVFPLPSISALLQKMVLVELYTDGMEPAHERNRDDQIARFGTAALPLYAVETASGQVLGTFPSSTNDPKEFERFLLDAMDRAQLVDPIEKPVPVVPRIASDAGAAKPFVLRTTKLDGGASEPAFVAGKWTLVNFWATYCGPCIKELNDFLAELGRDLEGKGGRFVTVAVEEDAGVSRALEIMKQAGVPDRSALRIPFEYTNADVDERFGFSGNLPFTALVSPEGRVAWSHHGSLNKEMLQRVLAEHLGYAALR